MMEISSLVMVVLNAKSTLAFCVMDFQVIVSQFVEMEYE